MTLPFEKEYFYIVTAHPLQTTVYVIIAVVKNENFFFFFLKISLFRLNNKSKQNMRLKNYVQNIVAYTCTLFHIMGFAGGVIQGVTTTSIPVSNNSMKCILKLHLF